MLQSQKTVPQYSLQQEEYDVFIVSSGYDIMSDERKDVLAYIEELESEGFKVYWLYRDDVENRTFDMTTCQDYIDAMCQSHEIAIWWGPYNDEIVFGIGAAMALKKPIRVANPNEFCVRTMDISKNLQCVTRDLQDIVKDLENIVRDLYSNI